MHCFFEIVSSWNWKGAAKKELLREYENLNRPPGFEMEHNVQSEAQSRVWRIIECIRICSNTNICSFDIWKYICTISWNLKFHESHTERSISNIDCRYIILKLWYSSYKCFIIFSSSMYNVHIWIFVWIISKIPIYLNTRLYEFHECHKLWSEDD